MRYLLTHRTSYRYAQPVDLAHHVLHLKLPDLAHQKVLAQSIRVDAPSPHMHETFDHFGNCLTYVSVEEPHDHFGVTLEADVMLTKDAQALGWQASTGLTPGWEQVARQLEGDGLAQPFDVSEFRHPSPLTPFDQRIRDYAAASFAPGRPILDAAEAITSCIHWDFRYSPGTTSVATNSLDVMDRRAGVCQDFAHVAIAALRSLGLAARYVSGYIRTVPVGGEALIGSDASHAWFALWCGDDAGWVEFDPTNNCRVGDDHIVSAYGRDFTDVSPIRGVIQGGQHLGLQVEVTVRPIGNS